MNSMDKNKVTTENRSKLSTVLKYIKSYKGVILTGGVCIVVTNSLTMVIPYIIKIILDLMENSAPMSVLLEFIYLTVALAVTAGIFRFFTRRTIIWTSRKIEYSLRSELFGHLLKLTPSFYHENRTGDIMARSTNDLEAVRMMVGPGIMHISNTIITLIVAIPLMLTLSPALTMYAMIPMALFPFIINRLSNQLYKRSVRIQEEFASLTSTAQENLSGIRVVRAYSQEDAETENFQLRSDKYMGVNMDMARVQALFMPLVTAIAALLSLSILYFGGVEVIEKRISLGTLVAFFAYLSMMIWPLIAIGFVISIYQRGMASLGRINKILHTEPKVKREATANFSQPMKGKIEFRNLSFAYNGKKILNNINLTIEPGKTIGLVGQTGSGKTTLVSLLPRLFPVAAGSIFIDDVDINKWDLDSLRSQIGVAPQEPFLFSDTVGANIGFGVDSPDREKMLTASRTAALDKDVIDFPKGYETIVGERGITLSGGQKQRTAMARAIMTEPRLLILDDAMSAVDTETEDEISHRIKEVLKNCTAIIISHRMSSVKDADQIVYLADGQIVEKGTHQELMAAGGKYAETYRRQLLERELEEA